MQDKPIGVFDSGLGGLTALKELSRIMPNENIVYFGDTGRAPYGNKSRETIIKYTKQDINFLMSKDVKFIVAACGTVSSAFDFSSFKCKIPLEGVLLPTCIATIKSTKNGKIGVIGTTATIKSESYKKILLSLNPKLHVYQQDCPTFVNLIEEGLIYKSYPLLLEHTKKYISKFNSYGIDTLILGCTHYSIIKDSIKSVLGNNVNLIDSGKETARFVFRELKKKNLLSSVDSIGKQKFFVSKSIDKFSNTANLLLKKDIKKDVKIINIELY